MSKLLVEVQNALDVLAALDSTPSMQAEAAADLAMRVRSEIAGDAKRYADSQKLQAIGKGAYESIADMVAALECDYDRLEELRGMDAAEFEADADLQEEARELREAAGECESREDAETRIQEDALSVEVRSGWYAPGGEGTDDGAQEFTILLSTGGPATRIMGELNEHGEPTRAWIQAQDWGTPWTDYIGDDGETLLTYCRCFYFGEG